MKTQLNFEVKHSHIALFMIFALAQVFNYVKYLALLAHSPSSFKEKIEAQSKEIACLKKEIDIY